MTTPQTRACDRLTNVVDTVLIATSERLRALGEHHRLPRRTDLFRLRRAGCVRRHPPRAPAPRGRRRECSRPHRAARRSSIAFARSPLLPPAILERRRRRCSTSQVVAWHRKFGGDGPARCSRHTPGAPVRAGLPDHRDDRRQPRAAMEFVARWRSGGGDCGAEAPSESARGASRARWPDSAFGVGAMGRVQNPSGGTLLPGRACVPGRRPAGYRALRRCEHPPLTRVTRRTSGRHSTQA